MPATRRGRRHRQDHWTRRRPSASAVSAAGVASAAASGAAVSSAASLGCDGLLGDDLGGSLLDDGLGTASSETTSSAISVVAFGDGVGRVGGDRGTRQVGLGAGEQLALPLGQRLGVGLGALGGRRATGVALEQTVAAASAMTRVSSCTARMASSLPGIGYSRRRRGRSWCPGSRRPGCRACAPR